MPWLYNPTPQVQSAAASDGSNFAFPPRKKTYVKPEQMSTYIWNLVRERKLANRGGDPAPVVVAKVPAPVKAKVKTEPKPKLESATRSAITDTSSSHHETHVKVSNESSGKRSAKKKPKAEKKQPDIQKKEDTQGNVEEKPRKKRKRVFKRKT